MVGMRKRSLIALGLVFAAWPLLAAVSLSLMSPVSREKGPKSISGITYGGGNVFYAVADEESSGEVGLYKLTLTTTSDGAISSFSFGNRIPLAMATDAEAVAYDPATGHVWVSNETGVTAVREYDPETGAIISTLDIPEIYRYGVYNYWIEGMTISGDGHVLWLCNEESLTCDGSLSSSTASATVRITKFERKTIRDRFVPVAQYAYVTDKWHNRYDYSHTARRGVSGLCALPNGQLMVLERELSYSSTDEISIFFGASYLGFSIYVPDFSSATDVSNIKSLSAVDNWKPVMKGSPLTTHGGDLMEHGNYEGLCLGQTHSDGKTSVILVADAGDTYSESVFLPALLSGLRVCTMDFQSPASGQATYEGRTYRFEEGDRIINELSGVLEVPPAYTNKGETVCTLKSCSWAVSGGAATSGSGKTADFKIGADGLFKWNVEVNASVDSKSHLLGNDTFEEYPMGTDLSSVSGWSGHGSIEAAQYNPPLPPGYPLARASHSNVLHVSENASRSCRGGCRQIDMMCAADELRMNRRLQMPNCRAAISADGEGYLYLYCATADAEGRQADWVRLTSRPRAVGEWFRVSFIVREIEATSGYLQVLVDGTPCRSAWGEQEPQSGIYPGTWHRLAQSGDGVAEVEVFGQSRLDDFICGESSWMRETAGPTTTNGVPYSWIDAHGLVRNPDAKAPGKSGYTLADCYVSGVNPYSDIPLTMTGFSYENGRVRIVFNGQREHPENAYRLDMTTDARQWSNVSAEGVFEPVANGGTVWTSEGRSEGCALYRLRAE